MAIVKGKKIKSTGQGAAYNPNLYAPGSVVQTGDIQTTYGEIKSVPGKGDVQRQTSTPISKLTSQIKPTTTAAPGYQWVKQNDGSYGQFVIPGGPSDPNTTPETLFGDTPPEPTTIDEGLAQTYTNNPEPGLTQGDYWNTLTNDQRTNWGSNGMYSNPDFIAGYNAWVEKQSNPPPDPNTTVDTPTAAEIALENDFQTRKEKSAADFAAGIIQTDPYANYATYDDWRAGESAYNAGLVANAESNTAAQNAIDDAAFGASRNAAETSIEGVKNSMSQSREGAMGSSAPKIASQFTERTMAAIKLNQDRLDLAKAQRRQALNAMRHAQELNDVDGQARYAAQIAEAEKDILAAEVQQAQLDESAARTAASIANIGKVQTETIQAQFDSMGERAADLTPVELSSMADYAGLSIGQVTAMQQTAVLTAHLENLKSKGDIEKNAKEIQKDEALIAQYAKELPTAGMTADQQNFEYYNGLTKENKEKYIGLLAIEKGSTLTKYTDANGVEHTIAFNPITNQSIEIQTSGDGGSTSSTTSSVSNLFLSNVTQGYGAPISYEPGGVHHGLDVSLPGGNAADVPATISGKVTLIPDQYPGVKKGYGNRVMITDELTGERHYLSHLSSFSVADGELVEAGKSIGKQGNTGYTIPSKTGDGTHVDFEIKDAGGNFMNPQEFLKNNQGGSVEYNQYGLLANTDANPTNELDKNAISYINAYMKSKNGAFPTATTMFGTSRGNNASKFAAAKNRAEELYYQATGSSFPDLSNLDSNKKLIAANNKLLNNQAIVGEAIARNFDLAIQGEITGNVNKNATVINRILNPIKLAIGDPATAAALVSNGTITQEFANLISLRNASGTTVSDKDMAEMLIPFGTSVEAQKAIVQRLRAEAVNIHDALADQNKILWEDIDPLQQNVNNPNRIAKLKGDQAKSEVDDIDLYGQHYTNSQLLAPSTDTLKW
jgi:murein DD-endopeptidase MepM/ murein hydrolase activator NlpD